MAIAYAHGHVHLPCHFFLHRRECPEIANMAMGFLPHSFPVGGMYMKGTGWLMKVKKKSLAPLFHCFLNVKKYFTNPS